MIQVNLLPGATSRTRKESSFDFSGLLSDAAAGIRDKYLLLAAGSVTLVLATVGLLYMGQSAEQQELREREAQALADSTRYKVVLEARASAEALRDSLYQQVAIIKSIDDSRFLWPHLLDEISNSLPQYTWLTSVIQTSTPPSSAVSDSVRAKSAQAGDSRKGSSTKERQARTDSVLAMAARATRFRLVGQTVDIQALTLFMKTLEASPFIQNVQLTRSDMAIADGKEVTEFQLEAESQSPPPYLIRTVGTTVGGE